MYRVELDGFSVEVDAETATNLEDTDYARRYLQALNVELQNDSDASDPVRDDLILGEEIQCNKASSRKFMWNHKAILLLLDLYKEYECKFETGQFKQGWKLISTTLTENGIKVSSQQCSSKMDTLKRRFKMIKDSQSKTGASPITWEYYSVMSEFFDKKSWAEPLKGAVSSTLASTSFNELAEGEPKPGCSKKKRKRNIEEILSDFKMERQKRDEEKKIRLEEKNRKRDESEIKKERRHQEKMQFKRELLNVLKNSTHPSA